MNIKKVPITVLLTVYNRPSVSETIESIICQSMEDFELLIIDNASTDNTPLVLQSYSSKDSRIKVVINDENIGQVGSLIKGVSLSKGKYIARIDADDIMNRDRLQTQFEYMENHPECSICGSWVRFIDDKDKLGFVIKYPVSNLAISSMKYFLSPFCHPSVMIRKSTMIDNSINYDSKYSMASDYDLWNRLLAFGEGHNIPLILTYYRRGNNNDSKNHSLTMEKETMVIKNGFLDSSFNGKEIISEIYDLERGNRRGFISYFKVKRMLREYMRLLPKTTISDYKIVKKELKRMAFLEFVINGTNCLSVFIKKMYSFLKKAKYRRER